MGTDWAAVRRRLEAAQAALARGATRSPELEARILWDRALELGREEATGARSGGVDVLEFAIGGERYAVETAFVVEVLALSDLTALPGAPDFVIGIVHVRGRVVCLNDLSRFLGLPQKGLSERDKVIVLRKGSMEIAVLAGAIEGTAPLWREDTRPLAAARGMEGSYVQGVTADGMSVLDAAAILDDPRLVVNQAD